jgi:hypothetical protein
MRKQSIKFEGDTSKMWSLASLIMNMRSEGFKMDFTLYIIAETSSMEIVFDNPEDALTLGHRSFDIMKLPIEVSVTL